MGADYDQVVAALPRLTPEERFRISERLKLLEAMTPGKSLAPAAAGCAVSIAAESFADEVLDAIVCVVRRATGERASPAMLRRAAGFRAFTGKAGELRAFFGRHAPDRVRRRALLEVGVQVLRDELAAAGFSVTPRLLMQCVHQLPAVLDNAFPGYARAGVLGMVVRKKDERDVRAQ